jgi:hypothetical protein
VVNSAPRHIKSYAGVEVRSLHCQPRHCMEGSAQRYALVTLPRDKMTPLSIG